MDLISFVVNKLDSEIKKILNKYNIVDFKSDKTRNISLENELALILQELKLTNNPKKATLIIVSKTNLSINGKKVSIGYYDSEKKYMTVNLRTIFEKNTLNELIDEYHNNNCERIKNTIIKVLNFYKEQLSEPEVSIEYKNLKSDIEGVLRLTNQKDASFIKSQIPNFNSRFSKLEDFEKNKINLQINQKQINETREAQRYSEIKNKISEYSDKVIDDFYLKIKKLVLKKGIDEPERLVKKLFSGKSKIISSIIFTLFQHNVKINIRFIRKDSLSEKQSQNYLAYYNGEKNRKFIYIEIFINNIAKSIDSEKPLGQSLLENEDLIKIKTHSLIYHEVSHILNIDKDYQEVSRTNLDNFKKEYSGNLNELPEEEFNDLEYVFDEDEREARIVQYLSYIERFLNFKKLEPTYENVLKILDDVIVYKSDVVDKSFYNKLLEAIRYIYT